jgi:hypothetical protein
MLQKIAMADDEESVHSDTSSNLSAPGSDRIEKLGSTSSGSAMSSVFGSSKRSASSSRASSRTPSPSARKSGKLPLPFHRRSSSRGDAGKREKEDHLARWLQGGNVIYKSVGLGLMDLAVGIRLIRYAKEKGIGTHVDGF